MNLLCVGTVFADIKGFPYGEYIKGGRNSGYIVNTHGGVARNIAENLASAGANVTLLSLVDESGLGNEIVTHLKECNVNTAYVKRVPFGMGLWLAVFNEKNDVVAEISSRPDLKPLYETLEESGETLVKNTDGILLELDIGENIPEKLIFLAGKYGIPVFAAVSNMDIARKKRDLIPKLSAFVCNEFEAGQFFGEEFLKKEPEKCIERLKLLIKESGIKRLIVTLGEDGSVYVDSFGKTAYMPAKKVSVIDTTGAGDAFFSGAVFAMTMGCSPEDILKTGTEFAALVVASEKNSLEKGELTM